MQINQFFTKANLENIFCCWCLSLMAQSMIFQLCLNSACWVIFHAFLLSVNLFENLFWGGEILSGISSECQTVWILLWKVSHKILNYD